MKKRTKGIIANRARQRRVEALTANCQEDSRWANAEVHGLLPPGTTAQRIAARDKAIAEAAIVRCGGCGKPIANCSCRFPYRPIGE
jgi:hypothetical protein